jgi:hypothetical protein
MIVKISINTFQTWKERLKEDEPASSRDEILDVLSMLRPGDLFGPSQHPNALL